MAMSSASRGRVAPFERSGEAARSRRVAGGGGGNRTRVYFNKTTASALSIDLLLHSQGRSKLHSPSRLRPMSGLKASGSPYQPHAKQPCSKRKECSGHQQRVRAASMFAFPAMTLAPFLFSLGFRRDGPWRTEASTTLALSFDIIAALIAFIATRDLGGLAQRVFIALLLCWTVLMGRHFVRLPHAM